MKISYLLLYLFSFLALVSCNGYVDVDIMDDNNSNVNAITILSLTISDVTINSFTPTLAFTNDINNNSTATFYYCNSTDTPGCDPKLGQNTTLSREEGKYTANITGLSNPGDTYNVQVVIEDSDGTSNDLLETTFTLLNNTPILDSIPNQTSITENSAITTVDAGDSGDDFDVDSDAITYTCFYDTSIDDSVASTNTCTSLSGVSFNTTTGVLNWTPSYTQSGTYEFKIIGSDGYLSDDEIFETTVTNVNRAPDLDVISDQTKAEASAITTVNAADDSDDLDVDLDTITYSCYYDTAINGAVASTNACTTLTGVSFNTTTGVMNWTPSYAQSGTYEFKIIGSDGSLSDDEIFDITVTNTNRAPVLDTISDQSSVAISTAISTINAADGGDDLDTDGDTITYTCFYDTSIDGSVASTNACSSLTGVTFTGGTGTMSWTPNSSQTGNYEFKIIGSDSSLSGSEIFSITVSGSPFTSVWRTTSPSESITLPLKSGYNYNFTVDWGDSSGIDSITAYDDSDITHTYASSGDYTVTISGQAEAWYFNNTGDKAKIIEVTDFGDMGWIDLEAAFYGCSNLVSFDGGDTSSVTSMNSMFDSASGLTTLDVSSFNTSNVLDMKEMFDGVSGISALDLTNFNTTNVTSMSYMFYGIDDISLDLSSFDTSNVTDFSFMFENAEVSTLDLSSFDTSNATTMRFMFISAWRLSTLDLSSFNTTNVTTMKYMFGGTQNLTSVDLSGFDTSNVTDMSFMFHTTGMTTINTSAFNTSKATLMEFMFYMADDVTTLDLSGFDTSNVTDMESMFEGTSSLTSIDANNWDINPLPIDTDILLDTNAGLTIYCNPVDLGQSDFFGETCN